MLMWILVPPLFAGVRLIKIRQDMETRHNLESAGFLYVGLKESVFYWEIFLHFRKVGLIAANVFLSNYDSSLRALMGLLFMIMYLELIQKV